MPATLKHDVGLAGHKRACSMNHETAEFDIGIDIMIDPQSGNLGFRRDVLLVFVHQESSSGTTSAG